MKETRPKYYVGEHYSFFRQYEEQKVILIGFCSPYYPKGAEKPYGEIPFSEMSDILGRVKKDIPQYEEYQIIVMLHHHFYIVEERDKAEVDVSYLRNSETLFEMLQNYNVCAILHGHKHYSKNKRINISTDIESKDRLVTVLGCGATAKTKGLNNNSINFIEVYYISDLFNLEYKEYELQSSVFKQVKALKLPKSSRNTKVISLLKEIEEHPDLFRRYQELREMDNNLYPGLDQAVDDALCTLPDTAAHIQKTPDILYYLLVALHYRSNSKRRHKDNYLDEVRKFFAYTLHDGFPKSRQCDAILNVLETEDVLSLPKDYNTAKKTCETNKQKELLVYLALGIMLAEFYITIKHEAELFFNKYIAQKAGFVNEGDVIFKGIVKSTIEFSSDEERRSLCVAVKCKNAAAHKTVCLIIKEFELVLTRLEQDFAEHGFKVFYIYPEIAKQIGKTTSQVESYSFSAYIPTLLPLLAGRSIYRQPEVFARELIQNAIDAIGTRLEVDTDFSPAITISFHDQQNNPCFRITDNGSGMDKYILERYLTTAGRSFYTSSDYNYYYRPISQFGIGFLSCFMLGKHVTVETMPVPKGRYEDEKQSYFLDIPNFDGCYFIEDGQKDTIGTTITVYPQPEGDLAKEGLCFSPDEIRAYIKSNIVNVPYPIRLEEETIEELSWDKKIRLETKQYGLCFYVPLTMQADTLAVAEETIKTQYGIYFYKSDGQLFDERTETAFNCGIRIETTLPFKELDDRFATYNFYDCCLNFPPNVLKLDVSRDTLTGITNVDWNGVFKRLEQKIALYIHKKYHRCLPYIIANAVAPREVKWDRLHISYHKDRILLQYKTPDMHNKIAVVTELFQQLVKQPDQKEISLVGRVAQWLFIALERVEKNSADPKTMDMATATATARAMDMAMDMDMDMDRARAMDMDMARAMDMAIDMARAMDMDMTMTMAMDMDMARAGAVDMDMDMDMDMARAGAVDMDMDMDMDMARAGDIVMAKAKAWDTDIVKATEAYREESMTKRANIIGYFFLYQLLMNYKGMKKHSIFDLTCAIVFALHVSPISSGWVYTLEEAEKGIEVDLIGALERFK